MTLRFASIHPHGLWFLKCWLKTVQICSRAKAIHSLCKKETIVESYSADITAVKNQIFLMNISVPSHSSSLSSESITGRIHRLERLHLRPDWTGKESCLGLRLIVLEMNWIWMEAEEDPERDTVICHSSSRNSLHKGSSANVIDASFPLGSISPVSIEFFSQRYLFNTEWGSILPIRVNLSNSKISKYRPGSKTVWFRSLKPSLNHALDQKLFLYFRQILLTYDE